MNFAGFSVCKLSNKGLRVALLPSHQQAWACIFISIVNLCRRTSGSNIPKTLALVQQKSFTETCSLSTADACMISICRHIRFCKREHGTSCKKLYPLNVTPKHNQILGPHHTKDNPKLIPQGIGFAGHHCSRTHRFQDMGRGMFFFTLETPYGNLAPHPPDVMLMP